MSAQPAADAEPLSTFSHAHQGILTQLRATAQLPELARAAERARDIAQATYDLFHDAVFAHHEEEEAELFTAVLRSATDDEKPRVEALVRQLTAEHREVEALWKHLEPAVRAVARGHGPAPDAGEMQRLVQLYLQHAQFEEQQFLPLAETILGRNGNHMAALGMALHIRHVPPRILGYL